MISLLPSALPLLFLSPLPCCSSLDVVLREVLGTKTASSFDGFSLPLLPLCWLPVLRSLADDINVILSLDDGSDLLLLQDLVLSPPRSSAQLEPDPALPVSLDSLETLNNSENYKTASSYPGMETLYKAFENSQLGYYLDQKHLVEENYIKSIFSIPASFIKIFSFLEIFYQ